jgi:hypothetical protein
MPPIDSDSFYRILINVFLLWPFPLTLNTPFLIKLSGSLTFKLSNFDSLKTINI